MELILFQEGIFMFRVSFHLSNEQKPGCLVYRRDYTTQLYWDCKKKTTKKIPINQPVFVGKLRPFSTFSGFFPCVANHARLLSVRCVFFFTRRWWQTCFHSHTSQLFDQSPYVGHSLENLRGPQTHTPMPPTDQEIVGQKIRDYTKNRSQWLCM